MSEELDTMDPISESIKLESGLVINIQELRLRQFIRFMRILTRGVLPNVDPSSFRLSGVSEEEFTTRLLTLVFMGIFEAEDETVEFLRSMVTPSELILKPVLQKSDVEHNKRRWADLDKEMINPKPGDTVTLIEAIVRREAKDLSALGKRLATMWKMAIKSGQVPESLSQIFQEENSSEDSQEPLTSSNLSTDGQTNTVTNSPSEELDRNLPSSMNDIT